MLGQLEKASGQAGQREGMGLSARNREEEFPFFFLVFQTFEYNFK